MKAGPVFIGDEAAAAGYRLAGLTVLACDPARASAALARVLAEGTATLVLIAAPHAERLGGDVLDRLRADCAPPLTVVRDAAASRPLPDLEHRLRAQLGVAT